jgi:hypothetical protein
MKAVFALAALAAIGLTGTAFAGDSTGAWSATTTTATAPAATATQMSDSEMDKVTAGVAGGNGIGHGYAFGKDPTTHGNEVNNGLGPRVH